MFTADFDASARALNVTNISGTVGTAQLKGDVLANFGTRDLGGALAIEAPSARDLLSALPEALRLDGALSATATLAGTVDAPEIVANVGGATMTLGGQPVDTFNVQARIVGSDVIVQALTLTQGTGSLTATGRYSTTARTFTTHVRGEGLAWHGAVTRLGNVTARISLAFTGSGTIDKPMGEGTINFDLSGGAAGALIGSGTAKVRLDGTNALITATIPSFGASVDAKMSMSKPFVYDALLVANKVDLEQVIRLAGLREGYVEGTASLNATASGSASDLGRSRCSSTCRKLPPRSKACR